MEEIKGGHVISGMYGHYLEQIFRNPYVYVIIFSNEDVSKYCEYLSFDRWQVYEIRQGELFEIAKNPHYGGHDINSRYISLDESQEKVIGLKSLSIE